MNYKLEVIGKYFARESNDLYDYDSFDYTVSSFTSSKAGYITRQEKNLQYVKENNYQEGRVSKIISRVVIDKDQFIIKFDSLNDAQRTVFDNFSFLKTIEERAWVVTRHCYCKEINGYRLKEGDIFKLGKDVFKVREIFIAKSSLEAEIERLQNQPLENLADTENHANEYTTLQGYNNTSRMFSGNHIGSSNNYYQNQLPVQLKKYIVCHKGRKEA